jgi:hypothetical protein
MNQKNKKAFLNEVIRTNKAAAKIAFVEGDKVLGMILERNCKTVKKIFKKLK